MMILWISLAVAAGWWCCWILGYRKYYRAKIIKVLARANALEAYGNVLTRKVERMEAAGIREDPMSLDCRIDQGIIEGIDLLYRKALDRAD